MVRVKKISSFNSFKSEMLPLFFERESNMLKEPSSDFGDKIAITILSGIEKEIRTLKVKKKKARNNNE